MFIVKTLLAPCLAAAFALAGCGACFDDYGNVVECLDESSESNESSCCDNFRFIEDQTACLQGLLDC